MTVVVEQQSVKSAVRTMEVLRFLAGRVRPAPACVIRAECAIPKSSVYVLLNAMQDQGFVEYFPAHRAWGLGDSALTIAAGEHRAARLEHLAQPAVVALAGELQGSAGLSVLRGALRGVESLCLVHHSVTGRPDRRGVAMPAHLTASGQAILSAYDEGHVAALYPSRSHFMAGSLHGPRSVGQLLELLRQAAARGYAMDVERTAAHHLTFALPVLGADDRVVGALSVELPAGPGVRDASAPTLRALRAHAQRLSARLGHRPARPVALAG